MERLFLEHTHRWLIKHGVLVLVIPYEQLSECAGVLSGSFTCITVFRMMDPESLRFRQVIVFAVWQNIRGAAIEDNCRRLQLLGRDEYSRLPVLERGRIDPFVVPGSSEAALTYRGLPYNLVEDLLPSSGGWRQVAPILLCREDTATGRPVTPLHGGHVGLLCTAGLLNGTFGRGEERHIARWRSIKHITEFHEEEGDTKIVRRREKWSNELRLIYVSGNTVKLTENMPDLKGDGDGERPPENGSP
jgi:hypothetical protein